MAAESQQTYRSVEIVQYEDKKNDKKKNRLGKTCGTTGKGLGYVSFESNKEKVKTREISEKMMVNSFPSFMKRQKLIHSQL